jgi:hypothetical protein
LNLKKGLDFEFVVAKIMGEHKDSLNYSNEYYMIEMINDSFVNIIVLYDV